MQPVILNVECDFSREKEVKETTMANIFFLDKGNVWKLHHILFGIFECLALAEDFEMGII